MSRLLKRLSPAWWEERTSVDPTTGCRNWNRTQCKQGYGRMWFKERSGFPAHRAAYACFYGPFDDTLKVCHTCDNRRCVNPYHLFLGTQKENLRDMFAKGRARPRGKIVRRRKAPLVTVPLASQNPHAGVTTIDIVHHIRTRLVTPRCRHAAVAPSSRPHGTSDRAISSHLEDNNRRRELLDWRYNAASGVAS